MPSFTILAHACTSVAHSHMALLRDHLLNRPQLTGAHPHSVSESLLLHPICSHAPSNRTAVRATNTVIRMRTHTHTPGRCRRIQDARLETGTVAWPDPCTYWPWPAAPQSPLPGPPKVGLLWGKGKEREKKDARALSKMRNHTPHPLARGKPISARIRRGTLLATGSLLFLFIFLCILIPVLVQLGYLPRY